MTHSLKPSAFNTLTRTPEQKALDAVLGRQVGAAGAAAHASEMQRREQMRPQNDGMNMDTGLKFNNKNNRDNYFREPSAPSYNPNGNMQNLRNASGDDGPDRALSRVRMFREQNRVNAEI